MLCFDLLQNDTLDIEQTFVFQQDNDLQDTGYCIKSHAESIYFPNS